MSTLRLTVGLLTIAALLALVYYTVLELSAVWRAMITLSYQPFTAYNEQNMYILLVGTIAFSILVILLLVVIVAILHFIGRLL
jgi:hypothetical protein